MKYRSERNRTVHALSAVGGHGGLAWTRADGLYPLMGGDLGPPLLLEGHILGGYTCTK